MSALGREEIRRLKRLRDSFLAGTAGDADYWQDERDLELYSATFGRRIGWKWDAVIGELLLRRWVPGVTQLVDLGCGTGACVMRVLDQWPNQFERVTLMDRSALARNYAASLVRASHPGLEVRTVSPREVECSGALVLASHVVSELSGAALSEWVNRLGTAAAVIWVESATHDVARRLVAGVRESLLEAGGWRVVAPCTHSLACPMLSESAERHWCHHFARVPSEAHQDAVLAGVAKELGLDLRVLPYSFMVMDKGQAPQQEAGDARVIGRALEYKAFLKVLSCQPDGLHEWTLSKRHVTAVFRELRKEEGVPLYRWKVEGERIVEGARLFGPVEGA